MRRTLAHPGAIKIAGASTSQAKRRFAGVGARCAVSPPTVEALARR
eukprot:CAMPEP_0170402154 /NCGR_PEP_ID=MMETSP0117_2-20130122/25407_1 /TAXON_ID=400756 /ORGANISM="Durinskia baltica, Strain CSIRO CS-38" /LENGTH=45 /DNA_ID= /DNA_START= /DNA_END= /DNA_ORIENTATION=